MKENSIGNNKAVLKGQDTPNMVDEAMEGADKLPTSINYVFPNELIIIPLRSRPVFPGMMVPIMVAPGKITNAVRYIIENNLPAGVLLLKDKGTKKPIEKIKARDFYRIGVIVRILKKLNLPDGGLNILVNPIKRFKVIKFIEFEPYIIAKVKYLEEEEYDAKDMEIRALVRGILADMKKIMDQNPIFTEEMKLGLVNLDDPSKLGDLATTLLNIPKEDQQEILETLNVKEKLNKVLVLLTKELEVISIQKKIQNSILEKVAEQQKKFFLREQLKEIQKELGIKGEKDEEYTRLKRKLEKLKLPKEAKEKAFEELEKLKVLEPTFGEYSVVRNYLEWIISLPWDKRSKDVYDLKRAEEVLNEDHYGLSDVKDRILEFLAIRKLNPKAKSSIICLVGPPGVGKTSLGKSIARALKRKFFRFSLGGMSDEAEIKGHRRTYIGAMPGKIIQALKIVKTKNPVIMLDEIDKLGKSLKGDPASALLEVLDPEQNSEFRDYYLDIPFDLSEVLFITTANTIDTIPDVLLDRMEIIRLSGYITEEKIEIAKRFLIPRVLKECGISKSEIKIDDDTLRYIIENYARESGVRNLERQIEKIARKVAKNKLTNTSEEDGKKNNKVVVINKDNIEEYLGKPKFRERFETANLPIGVAVGLAWTQLGGAILHIEAIAIKGKSQLKITGNLGSVMKESCNIAFNYAKKYAISKGISTKFFDNHIFHIHIPSGATPKDGPSAGITIATAILSLVFKKKVRDFIGMTGELSLTGKVLPVGGIKEKIIAGKRNHIKEIILPKSNQQDVDEIPDIVKEGLSFHFVENMEEVVKIAFGEELSYHKTEKK
jgi:ATP-dependent Lon protease